MVQIYANQKIEVTEFDAKRLNALLITARNSKSGINKWLDRLQLLLEKAELVSSEQIKPDTVTMNSQIRLHDKVGNEEMRLTLVFPATTARKEIHKIKEYKVSILSPMGLSVYGRKIGDMICNRILIAEILYQPEAAGDYEL